MEGCLAEIRLFAGNFAPRGWPPGQGQILSIAQNAALFSLLGEQGGVENVTLTTNQIPTHNHQFALPAARDATTGNPANALPGKTGTNIYGANATGAMKPGTTSNAGGSQPHQNRPLVAGRQLHHLHRRPFPQPQLSGAG